MVRILKRNGTTNYHTAPTLESLDISTEATSIQKYPYILSQKNTSKSSCQIPLKSILKFQNKIQKKPLKIQTKNYYSKSFKKVFKFQVFKEDKIFINNKVLQETTLETPEMDFDCSSDAELIKSAQKGI